MKIMKSFLFKKLYHIFNLVLILTKVPEGYSLDKVLVNQHQPPIQPSFSAILYDLDFYGVRSR